MRGRAALRTRRLALAVPSLVTAGGLAWLAALAYPAGVSPLAWAVLVLFGLVMGWQAFVACQYVYGLVAALPGRPGEIGDGAPFRRGGCRAGRGRPHRRRGGDPRRGRGRGVRPPAGDGPLARPRRALGAIDIFVLSDTRDGAIAAVEEHEFARIQAWAAADPALPRIRYRRRTENVGRKAGNIGEFCRSYGAEYAFMIVLDADSLMTGDAMRRLVAPDGRRAPAPA